MYNGIGVNTFPNPSFLEEISMFEFLIKKLKAHPRKIVFTEGTDPRILEASARLLSGTFLTPVLVGNPAEVQAAAEEAGFNIRAPRSLTLRALPTWTRWWP